MVELVLGQRAAGGTRARGDSRGHRLCGTQVRSPQWRERLAGGGATVVALGSASRARPACWWRGGTGATPVLPGRPFQRNLGVIAYTAEMQSLLGLPVDGTRGYTEQSCGGCPGTWVGHCSSPRWWAPPCLTFRVLRAARHLVDTGAAGVRDIHAAHVDQARHHAGPPVGGPANGGRSHPSLGAARYLGGSGGLTLAAGPIRGMARPSDVDGTTRCRPPARYSSDRRHDGRAGVADTAGDRAAGHQTHGNRRTVGREHRLPGASARRFGGADRSIVGTHGSGSMWPTWWHNYRARHRPVWTGSCGASGQPAGTQSSPHRAPICSPAWATSPPRSSRCTPSRTSTNWSSVLTRQIHW